MRLQGRCVQHGVGQGCQGMAGFATLGCGAMLGAGADLCHSGVCGHSGRRRRPLPLWGVGPCWAQAQTLCCGLSPMRPARPLCRSHTPAAGSAWSKHHTPAPACSVVHPSQGTLTKAWSLVSRPGPGCCCCPGRSAAMRWPRDLRRLLPFAACCLALVAAFSDLIVHAFIPSAAVIWRGSLQVHDRLNQNGRGCSTRTAY